MPAHVHALRQVRHSGLRLVPARRRRDRRDRRGPVDVVPRRQPFPGGDRDLHRAPRPASSITRLWGVGCPTRWAAANQNLPTFVNIGRPSSPVQLTGGYLGATVAATPFQPGDTPIPNLYPPGNQQRGRARAADAGAAGTEPGVPRALRASTPTSRRASQAYELAARMQLTAPDGRRFLPGAAARARPLRHRRKGDRRLRPAAAAGAPAGGKGRPLHPDLPRRRRQRRLGRARRHEDPRAPLPRDRQADRRPDPRPEAARHARLHAGRSGPASSAAARGRRTPPAAITTPRLHGLAGRRRRQGRHRSTAPPTTWATRRSSTRTITATCTPRSFISWGSTIARWR